MICLTKLFQQKRRRIGYILAFSDPTISKRDSSDLSDNNLALVFYSLGEKYIIQKGTYQSIGQRYDLSGAYCYHDKSFEEIQPMHISNTL